MTVAYCDVTDLLTGNLPTSGPLLNPPKFISDATDEIDSIIGFRYVTPLDIDPNTSPLVRPAQLLIKRICVWLATGRLMLAITASTENNVIQAYGKSLIDQAMSALTQIAAGDVLLDGAPTVTDPENGGPIVSAPLLFNQDAESAVEAYYDRVVNPNVPRISV